MVKRWTKTQSSLNNETENNLKNIFYNFKQFNLIKQLPPLYFISSLLFCLHPIHTEPVAGLVGRADTGCALFFLLSLYFYDNYLKRIYKSNGLISLNQISSNVNSNVTTNRATKNDLTKINNEFNLSNDLKERGRSEFKERRSFQTIRSIANDQQNQSPNTTSKWSTYFISLIQLYFSIICATISMLFKEYGITIFLVCALYHLITHLNYLASQTNQSKRLVNLNLLRRRWQTTMKSKHKLTINRPEEKDELCVSLQSKFNAFVRCLHAILNNVSLLKLV